MLIILMLTLIFNKYKQLVDEWTSERVDKLLVDRVKKRQSKGEDRVTKEQKANRSLQPFAALRQQEIIMTDSYLSNPNVIG